MRKFMLIIWMIILLQSSHGHIPEDDPCERMEFLKCQSKISFFSHGDSDLFVQSVEVLEKECKIQEDAVTCVKNFVRRCMNEEERQIFSLTSGGRIKLMTEICSETDVRKKYVENINCFQRIKNDTAHCQGKFEIAQNRINDEVENLRMKQFHSCCAFDWLRQCKVQATEKHCEGSEASAFVEYMSMTLGGKVLKLCDSVYPSCFGQLYPSNKRDSSSADRPIAAISLIVIFLLTYFKKIAE